MELRSKGRHARSSLSPGQRRWGTRAALLLATLVIVLVVLPPALEHWLEAPPPPPSQPALSQSELDQHSLAVNAQIDTALQALGVGPEQMVRETTKVTQGAGRVWESRFQDAILPKDTNIDGALTRLRSIASTLPQRCTWDVVQPDILHIEAYANVGKARVRHLVLRIVPADAPNHPAGTRPAIAMVLLPSQDTPPPRPQDLPAALTVALSPHQPWALESASEHTRHGNEVLVALDQPQEDWKAGLSSLPDLVGALIVHGREDPWTPESLQGLTSALAVRRLEMVDYWQVPDTLATQMAREAGVEAAPVDLALEEDSQRSWSLSLDQAESVAALRGGVVLALSPSPELVTLLSTWIPEARERGLQFVFVHELLVTRPRYLMALSAAQDPTLPPPP